ncbi:hypothetical protein ACQ4LE_010993 [Meloidogyne hapla]
MTTTHHALPYLNADQCMLRPGQKEHGSYGLIFFRPNFYLCDKLLICYPSQLSGNNTRNGIIASIPYRLRDYEQNIVTNSCEVKRKEFCDNAKNKHLCSLGQPASTIWHGIMLSTEYFYNVRVFVTTILLSISKQKYTINNTLHFNIEFGEKSDVFTYAYKANNKLGLKYEKTKIILGDDYLFAHEYLSNITKGLYLHKYSGLWTLGLDMLPSEAQRYLHLFVYRDCGCTINVWFKNPTTPDSLIPKSPNISQTIGKGLLFKDKDCTKRYTNKSIHELGTIEDGEKIVRFALWTGNEGKEGTIELFDSKDDALLKIHFNGYLIEFDHHGDKRNKEFSKNLLSIGARIDITIRLSKYYVWALFQSDVFDNFVEKFWPKEWWKGNFLFKSEVKMSIFGDFLMVTPLFIQTLEMEETNYLSVYYWSKRMNHVVHMPHSFEIYEIISTKATFVFYLMINDDSMNFSLKLMNGVEEDNLYIGTMIYGLEVDDNLKNVSIISGSVRIKIIIFTNLQRSVGFRLMISDVFFLPIYNLWNFRFPWIFPSAQIRNIVPRK